MRRKALMFVLAIGAVAGFASGIWGCRHHHEDRRQAFEDHVADVCMRAAERSRGEHNDRPHVENRP